MRTSGKLMILGVLLMASALLARDNNSSTNQVRLTVEVQDGSRVIGMPKDDSLQIRSEILGEAKLPFAGISSVECRAETNLATVKTTNGDTLSVKVVSKAIHLATSFGEVNLPTDSIRRINVSRSLPGGIRRGLVGQWSGDGTAANSVDGRSATIVGDVSFISGKRAQAFSLDGRSYLRIPVTPQLDVGKEDGLTIEGWIKPATANAQMPIIEYEQTLGSRDGSDVGVMLYINYPPSEGQGNILANLMDTARNSHLVSSSPNLVRAGKWQHIALTYDRASGEAVIYLNGNSVLNKSLGSFTPETGFTYLLIGARTAFGSPSGPSDAFSGGLDEIGIYNRALSAMEIQAIYGDENGGAEAD